jgi:hypothetical protein
MRVNCVIWAYALWWRRFRKGIEGHVTTRKSRWGFFPHFCYAEYRPRTGTLRMVSYKPVAPTPRRIPPLFFEGYVAWGDNPYPKAAEDGR